jgi:WG containing repeat
MAWRLISLLLLFPAAFLRAQGAGSGELLKPFSKTYEHCGYKDLAGRVVVEPQLGQCMAFSEGVALVQERGKSWDLQRTLDMSHSPTDWGYIDENGKYLLKFKARDYLPGGSFIEGLAPIYNAKTHKYGYIDHNGKIAIPAQFDFAESFSEGFAGVCSGEFHRPGQGFWLSQKEVAKIATHRCGFIDHSGELKIPYSWNSVGGFHEGKARFRNGKESGYIDKIGKVVAPPQ